VKPGDLAFVKQHTLIFSHLEAESSDADDIIESNALAIVLGYEALDIRMNRLVQVFVEGRVGWLFAVRLEIICELTKKPHGDVRGPSSG